MIECDFQRVGSMSSTENYFISPIVIRVNASTIKSFQTSLWVHCSPKFHWNVADFPAIEKSTRKGAQDCFLPIFFANQLKLAGRDAALVFCDIFKTQVECLTYVAAGGWVAPLTSHFPPKRLLPCKNSGRAQKAKVFRFLHNCEIIHGGKLRPSFCFFLSKCQKMTWTDRQKNWNLIDQLRA